MRLDAQKSTFFSMKVDGSIERDAIFTSLYKERLVFSGAYGRHTLMALEAVTYQKFMLVMNWIVSCLSDT